MNKIAFFDFAGTLFQPTPQGWRVCPDTAELLMTRIGQDHRIGLLGNLPPGHDEESRARAAADAWPGGLD